MQATDSHGPKGKRTRTGQRSIVRQLGRRPAARDAAAGTRALYSGAVIDFNVTVFGGCLNIDDPGVNSQSLQCPPTIDVLLFITKTAVHDTKYRRASSMDAMAALAALLSAVIAIAAAVFSLQNARGGVRSAEIASRALERTNVLSLFNGFHTANQATLQSPELLYDVHGLDRNITIEEARNIAYLSVLLDAFQSFYDDLYDGDFTRMAGDMKKQSTFLNKILSIPANEQRWKVAKNIYYGDFDAFFISAIDDLLQFEKQRSGGANNTRADIRN